MGVILIAFERESEQTAVEQLLAGRGHRVVRSANGLAALDTARREPPHAVVADIVLPRMDGFALCRKWKQDERLQAIPFLFYTRRHDDPKYERFALELGAERFLARSVAPEALLEALDELLVQDPKPASRTMPLPALDERAINQAAALEQAQQAARAEAAEKLQQAEHAQARLRAQLADLEAAKERLAAGEARFRRVFEANPLPMWMADQQTSGFIAVNDAALALYGYSRAEFLALKSPALEAPGVAALAEDNSDRRLHRRKDGSVLTVSVAATRIEFDGRSADLVCACDLTQHVRTEQQLHGDLLAQRSNRRQLEFLVDLFKQSESFDESAIVRRLIEQAADVTSSPLAFLYFADPARRTIALAAWCDHGEFNAAPADVAAESIARAGLFAECTRARRASSSNDPAPKPQQDGLPDLHRYLAVPMLAGEETVAILGVANREAGYSEADQHILASLADGAWRVLHAKRAHAQTLRSLQRTDVALQGMIDSMVRMSERHDPHTAGSARRLAALAVALGREAGLDGERQHALRVAALLHDIGNIAVPASILAKPAALTSAELALMRSHVEEGCKLLAEIDFGAPVADIIYQSHERCDGSGYPRGLKSEEILLEARILAIADTVEAMCSPRPHRPAAGIDAALDEINRGAGRLFDLHVVAACTRLFRQHRFVLPE